MAYRRSIAARANLFYRQQRVGPSFSHIHRDNSDHEELRANPISPNSEIHSYIRHQFLRKGNSFGTFGGSRNLFHNSISAIPVGSGLVLSRNFSTGPVGGGAADKIEILNDVVDALGDKSLEVAPQLSEVAVAAVDSFFPVAALQFLIEYIHNFMGVNWWAAIALTTLLIRCIQIPVVIHQVKATSKFTLLRPKLEAVKEDMQNRDMSPSAVAEGQAKMKALFKEYGVTPFTPMKGLLISGPIFCCFFFAVSNMAAKVPSFKEGGTLWFTDLMTPDSMYIFPVLTALTFWITVELNAQEGMEGNPSAGTVKNVSRAFSALTIPLTASFPKAIFCYWITSNLFSLTYGLVIKRPAVKKLLGIPIITPQALPPSTSQKPGFSFFESLSKFAAAQQQISRTPLPPSPSPSPSLPDVESPKSTSERISSSSVLSQRIKSLEKEVRSRKKGKKNR